MAKIQGPKEGKTYSNIYKEEWTQPWPMGSEIYPEVHENPRAFFSSFSPILLESSIQYPWGDGLHQAHFCESSSSNSPTSRESKTIEFEAEVMAEEQPRRVTFEDYSSTSVLQYFSSVARPEVQAQNLTYPPSLI